MPGRSPREEGPRSLGVAVAPPDEDAGRELAEPELAHQRAHLARRAGTDGPAAVLHGQLTVRPASDGIRSACGPDLRIPFATMLRRAVVLVAFVALACAAAPGATRIPSIAPGVIVSGVYVGDLTSEPARAQLAEEFARPLRVVYGKQHWVAYPQQLGGGATIDRAVAEGARRGARHADRHGRELVAREGRRVRRAGREGNRQVPGRTRRSRASARRAR